MYSSQQNLTELFHSLSDEELLRQGNSGKLIELAQAVAQSEASARGLVLQPMSQEEIEEKKENKENTPADASADQAYLGDMQIVTRLLSPTEAHLLSAYLQTQGIPAEPGDTHLIQAYGLLAPIVGGACVRVPASLLDTARQAIAAYDRGDFQLAEDFDVGQED